MISINLTLVIELILFLLFFIFARKYVWNPLINRIREREEYFNHKEVEIERIYQQSKNLHEDYRQQIEETKKTLDLRADKTIRDAYKRQRELIEQEQKKAMEQLNQFRNELQKQFCVQNKEIEIQAEILSEKIVQCLIQQKRIF